MRFSFYYFLVMHQELSGIDLALNGPRARGYVDLDGYTGLIP